MSDSHVRWSVVCHLDYGSTVNVVAVDHYAGDTRVQSISAGDSQEPQPWFFGLDDSGTALVMEPAARRLERRESVPANSFPSYSYADPDSDLIWFMYDGEKETGADPLNCGPDGSSVTIVDRGTGRLEKILCVGRGHHVTTFTFPSRTAPQVSRRAFVSNLQDGSISVVGNDRSDSATYLQVTGTINLCEPAREQDGTTGVPNNAFPHGMVYSPATGKLYNLNNGYGTIAVIDPATAQIEQRWEMKKSSNLLLSPDGRYLIGKGADRKSDPDHILGRLTVMDTSRGETGATVDLPDVYPSTYRFSPDGSRLYVTTAATGKGTQRDNLSIDKVLVFDASSLPALTLLREVEVGRADCGRRPIAFLQQGSASRVFIPNPTDGTLTVLEGTTDTHLETVNIGEPGMQELNFSFWRRSAVYGC